MKYVLFAVLLTAISACDRLPLSPGKKQMSPELWWSYLADYDGMPGSILTDLALKTRAPVHGFPIIVVTGISYQSRSDSSGLPDPSEFEFLERLGTKRLNVIAAHCPAILAGSFTHKNERLDYIYVVDAAGLEAELRSFYQTECATRQFYINVKNDPEWKDYLEFLYPNVQTVEYYRRDLIKLGALEP